MSGHIWTFVVECDKVNTTFHILGDDHMPKIGFSWDTIRLGILNEFRPDFRNLDVNDFMKLIFPEEIFNDLFIQDDIYRAEMVCAVYSGQSAAEPICRMMAEKLGKKNCTYDKNKAIEKFRLKWEALLPFTEVTGGAPNMEDEKKRWELRLCISDIVYEIPEELTNIKIPINLLIDQQKYSFVLAILSVMATAFSKFETNDSLLYDNVLPVINNNDDGASFDRLCQSATKITWEMLHNHVFKRLCKDKKLNEQNAFLKNLIPQKLQEKLFYTQGKPDNPPHYLEKNGGYVYLGKRGAGPKYQAAYAYIIGQKSSTGEPYTWNTHPTTTYIKKKWEELIPQTRYSANECASMADSEAANMKVVIDCFLDAIPSDPQNVASRLKAITANQPYSMVLAILSIIASTLFCFAMEGEKPTEEDLRFYDLVLPPLPVSGASSTLHQARVMCDDSSVSLKELEKQLEPICPRNGKKTQPSDRDKQIEQGEGYFLLYKKAIQEENTTAAKFYLQESRIAGYLPANQIANEKKAEEYLDKAKRIFDTPSVTATEATRCCNLCEMVLQIPTLLPKGYRADASYILYKYISDNKYTPATGETAEYYLEISYMYGHELATEEWKMGNISSIAPHSSRSDCGTEGICYKNADNVYAAMFEKTIPFTWGGALVQFNLKTLEQDFFNTIPRRFLFISDDFSKNLDDLFQSLQLIKNHKPRPGITNWEFFVRHDSESIHALVDTALSRLSEYKIPVYILNDSKIAAQQLLSQHPLFYPVRDYNLDKIKQSGDQRPLLHFVVLGSSPVTEWLVREAFWMMGFRDNVIRSRITILAEAGKKFEESLKGRFPGMGNGNTVIDGIDLPEIKGEDIVLESVALQDKIKEFTDETDYCYFAVATDSDENNLTLATRVREALIRAAIKSKKMERLDRMSPVAFLCRNSQIAWLSKYMIVEKEDYGNSWFNTRALIPFGETSNRYSFDSITGGTFEQLAKCIHYQYNQLVPVWSLEDLSKRAEEEERTLAADKDYYLRQYNQDSSYSMALGMPYRLFQFRDAVGNQITPPSWNILQRSSFSSANQLHILAMRIKISSDIEKQEFQTIAEWEHARWVRWMLSRGWRAATIEESVFAYNCGNPRQQMFACKMHPCICSYDALESLSAQLKINCGLNKDFYSYDYLNIKATKELLDLEWIVDKSKEKTKQLKEIMR